MKIIGLTGGIASGKSTVAQMLLQLGAPIFDADQASKDAVAKGSLGLEKVIQVFGQEYLSSQGELDRVKIAQLVFQDKQALKKLENIIHELVWQAAEDFLATAKAKGEAAVVLDVPLLIECDWYKSVDLVWLVAVSEQTQIERAMKRTKMTEQEVKARIAAQMSLEEKKKFADLLIDNSGELAKTRVLVTQAWQAVIKMED